MGFDFVEHTIRQMFNEQETKRDKEYFCKEMHRIIKDFEREIEEEL